MTENRKIIKIAERTFVVSLPNKWLENFNLKKGDSVSIEEIYNKIILSTKPSKELYETSIDLTNADSLEEVEVLLSSTYKKGYDLIKIKYSDKSVRNFIYQVVKSILRDFKIVKDSEDLVILKNTLKEKQENIRYGLRRTFNTTLTLADQILKDLKNNKNPENISYLEEENDHVTSFTQRLLNKFGYFDFKKTTFVYVIVRDWEKICDQYNDLLIFIRQNKTKPSKEILDYFKETNKLLREYSELFYKFDIETASLLKKRREELKLKGTQLLKRERLAHYLLNVNERLTELAGPIIAVNKD